MPLLERGKALISLCVSHSQEEAKGKRTLAIYDISLPHFHGVPVRRVFVELLDEEKERLAGENGPDLEHVGLLRRCMYGTVDASAHWQGHQAHGFVQGLGNPSLFVHVERDVRLLVHVPTLKRNGSKASCSRNTMESARRSSIQMATL